MLRERRESAGSLGSPTSVSNAARGRTSSLMSPLRMRSARCSRALPPDEAPLCGGGGSGDPNSSAEAARIEESAQL